MINNKLHKIGHISTLELEVRILIYILDKYLPGP